MGKILLCVNLLFLFDIGYSSNLQTNAEETHQNCVAPDLSPQKRFSFLQPQQIAEELLVRNDKIKDALPFLPQDEKTSFDLCREVSSIERHLDSFLTDVERYNTLEQSKILKENEKNGIKQEIEQKMKEIERLKRKQTKLTEEINDLKKHMYGISYRMLWTYNLPCCNHRIERMEKLMEDLRSLNFRN